MDEDDEVVKEKTSADAEDVPVNVQGWSSEEEEPLAAKYQQRKALDKVSSATDNVTIVKRKRRNDEVDPDDEDDDKDAFQGSRSDTSATVTHNMRSLATSASIFLFTLLSIIDGDLMSDISDSAINPHLDPSWPWTLERCERRPS